MLEIIEPMFYVATNGCDMWSGKFPEPNEAGSQDRPSRDNPARHCGDA
jgi:hypothetical protein